MRSGLALVLVMTLAVPPRLAHAGGWSTQQHAALEKIIDLENRWRSRSGGDARR
jgi:hypothetical protein